MTQPQSTTRVETGAEAPDHLARARAGDAEAFCELVRADEARLFRQALTVCGNVSLAEDLAQETLLTAWRSMARFNGRCQFFTWLCGILLNLHRNFIRKERGSTLSAPGVAANGEAEDWFAAIPEPGSGPDERLHLLERAAIVRRCLERLPEKHRAVVYLRFFVDDSLESIAVALDCSLGTVKSRLFHGLDKLTEMRELNQLVRTK